MWKKLVLITFLVLALTYSLSGAFQVKIAGASGTIYIRATGEVEGTDKIERDGDLYTFTDNINDSIVVERDNIVVDGAGYKVQGSGSGKGIYLSYRSNVTIKNTNINNFDNGIVIEDSFQINVSGNNVTNNWFGIMLSSSLNNTLVGNVISDNGYNFGVSGAGSWDNEFLCQFIHRVDISNLVEGKPIYYWVNEKDKAVPLDAGYVALVNCTRITVQNLNLTKNWQGILLHSTSNSTITRNNITTNYGHGVEFQHCSNISVIGNDIMANNGHGIDLSWSFNNALSGNKIANNHAAGIHLSGPSNNNSIIGNTMSVNADGINLEGCLNCSIFGNNVSNSRFGILLDRFSNYNIISGNNATANNWYGIGLYESSNNNTISENSMIANKEAGIALSGSSNNRVYHNNFINNADQVHVSPEYANVWDDGYPSGGNYWSDYNGTDSNKDGIGDSWYQIDENNTDNYPLMGMFSSFNTSLGYHVNVVSNSTLESFEYLESNGTIMIYLSGEGFGFCRVCIPHDLMNEPYSVIINGTDVLPYHVDCELFDNGTHRWIYFTYKHSILEVVIVPEFPSLFILPLFMTATLLAVIVYRRKQKSGFVES